jgi:hypothetical protein
MSSLASIRERFEREGRPWAHEYKLKPDRLTTTSKKADGRLEKIAKEPSVRETGAPDGSILVGTRDHTEGGLMHLQWIEDCGSVQTVEDLGRDESVEVPGLGRVFSASAQCTEPIKQNAKLSLMLCDALRPFAHFRDDAGEYMNDEAMLDRVSKLTDKMSNHRAIGEFDTRWRLRVIALPNGVVEEIDNNDLVQAIVARPYPYWHVSELIEIVMNAKSMARVLTFMRGAW